MNTLQTLYDDFQIARINERKLKEIHLKERSIKSFENWKIARSVKLELNALIQSW